MKYSEETLRSWTAPLSDSEEKRAENTIKMIGSAIDSIDELKAMNIEVFTQGSFANNTNVRSDSDVDVCVMLKDTFHAEFPEGAKYSDYGFIVSGMTFQKYRGFVKRALQKKFGAEFVKEGNKSLKIDENTYHVKADVVPAFQFRNYSCMGSIDPDKYVEGIWLVSKNGKGVANYPEEHKQNGISKNNDTNYRYKKLIRIMKHIKTNMVDEHVADGNKITSFLVECLIWNVPNEKIKACNTWTDMVREAIRYLYLEMCDDRHYGWREVSEMLNLFTGRKWTDKDVKIWLERAWIYLGFTD